MKKSIGIIGSHTTKIGIIIVVLLLSTMLHIRLDFSRDNAYSLSKISKDLVRSLDDAMVVNIIASPELPAELNSLSRYAGDLLAEYQSAGGAKFRFEYQRPSSRDELNQMAAANGLRPMPFRIYENDQMISKEVIFGMVFEYQGRTEAMNLMPRIEPKLEYEMTMRIQSLVAESLPKVAVFRDSTYFHFNTSLFERGLKSNFNIVEADLSQPLPDLAALLFTGSSRNLPEEYLYHVDQYLMKGGNVVFLQDKVDTDGTRLFQLNTNVVSMLEYYGFQLSDDVVLDRNGDQRQMGIGKIANFPMYPIMRGGAHPISRNMDFIVLYLASGITFSRQEGVDVQTILSSSAHSGWMYAPEFQINEDLFFNPELAEFSAGPIQTAVLASGHFKSYFAANDSFPKDADFAAETQHGKIVLFADKELVIDPDNPLYYDRSNVILNALDYLTGREAMIRIRNRHLSTATLSVPSFMDKHGLIWGDTQKTDLRIKLAAKIVAIALPSLILILTGLGMALRRKLRLRSIRETK